MSVSKLRDRQGGDGPGALGGLVHALKQAYLRVREEVKSAGWVLAAEPMVSAGDRLIFRFAMQRDGVVASDCGFVVGPGPGVVFTRPAERAFKAALDHMGEPEFRRLIGIWAAEVQQGIGHRWRYEAKVRSRAIAGRASGPGVEVMVA